MELGGSVETIAVNLGMLERDTVVYLSITDSVREINSKIRNIPHNLNGYNLAFIFVVPNNYDDELGVTAKELDAMDENSEESKYTQYFIDIGNQNILFSNFFNGTLFVFGDFLHSTYTIDSKGNSVKNFSKFTKKTAEQISDPVKYDLINPTQYIKKLYKEIDNPESIIDIINFEGHEELVSTKNLNKIKIKGTGLNSYYSLLTFSDITAKTYIKNLSFESTLTADENVINVDQQLNSNLPTADKLFLQYPLAFDGVPIIGDSFVNYLKTMSNEPYFNKLSGFVVTLNSSIESLYGIMANDSFIIRGDDFANFQNIDDDFITILRNQLDQLKDLPGVTDDWLEVEIDEPEYSILSTSILTELGKFNVDEEMDDGIISQNDINSLINAFNNAFDKRDLIEKSVPKTKYEDYVDGTKTFQSDDFISEVKTYMSNVKEFVSDLSGAFGQPAFSIFLSFRPDLISSEYNTYTNDEAYNEFISNFKIPAFFKSIEYALSSIQINVIDEIVYNNMDNLSGDLSFSQVGQMVKFSHIKPLSNSSDDFVESNYSDGSVDSLDLSYDNLTSKYGYLTLSNNRYLQHLGALIFNSNHWSDITQKSSTNLNSLSPMFDSTYDVTLTFWTKYRSSTDLDQVSLISFRAGSDEFKFSIKPKSFSSISKNQNPDVGDDSYGSIDSSDIVQDVDSSLQGDEKYFDRNAWTLWSIKFDNTSRSRFTGSQSGEPDFRHLIGLNVTTYTFKEDLTGKSYSGYNIIKHNLNQVSMDDKTEDFTIGADKFKANYVWEPFEDSKESSGFENFTINIGYSKEPTANNENIYYFNGFIRNLTLFKGHLTSNEEEALFRLGILNDYEWPTEYETDELRKLIQSGKFFFGLVSVYDSNNINIINCNSKYNGNTYIINS